MKLDEFVKQTLLDITNAVADAQAESKLYIAPGTVEGQKVVSPQSVQFDIAVTTNKEGGGGISILSFGEAKASLSSEVSNRISFSVPVYFQAPTPENRRHFSYRIEKEVSRQHTTNNRQAGHVIADVDLEAEEEE